MKINRLLLVVTAIACLPFSSVQASQESWYFNLGLGYGIPSYPSFMETSITALKNSGATNTPIALDLGFYWPAGSSTILGVAINGMTDSYEADDGDRLSIVQTGVFFSSMHFFGKEPGSGFYLRGDVGAGRLGITTNLGISAASEYGFGAGPAAGFGIAVSEATRLLLQVGYMYRRVEGDNYGSTAFTVSGLF